MQETYRLTDDLHRYYRFEFACGFVRPEKEVDGRVVRHHLLAQDETRPTVRSVFDGQAPNETLFNVLWTAPQWSEEDAEAAQAFSLPAKLLMPSGAQWLPLPSPCASSLRSTIGSLHGCAKP